jgi:hypothetical protein
MNLILSPILNGKKNRITPDVILLKIDHCANIATPTTVVTDEMAIIISLGWTTQIMMKAINPNIY